MIEFDIHIDALTLTADFENYLKDQGFWRSDFSGHPEGAEAYEPPNHLTQKTVMSSEFRALFDKVLSYVKTHNAMKGYIEGEFIALDQEIEERPFNPSVKPPFTLRTTFLPPGTFRQDEIHIAVSRDESDPRLLRNLMEMGLFAAYIPKPWGIEEVFTAQGLRKDIDAILPPLMEYLKNAGGSVHCSIKEERVADWWLSEAGLRLPPVIGSIEWKA
jgi:hypothetical protein